MPPAADGAAHLPGPVESQVATVARLGMMRAVAIDLGTSSTAAGAAPGTSVVGGSPPPATRSRPQGWRDPRLWVGVVLVAGSVLLGARVLAAADDSVAVWGAATDLAAGDRLGADDLVAVRVGFDDAAAQGGYLATGDPLPQDAVLTREVSAGELVPAAALGAAGESGLLEVPVAVDPEQVAGSVSGGSRVNVYLVDRGGADRGYDSGEPVLEDVAVVEASAPGQALGASGRQRLVLAVPEDDASRLYALLGQLDDPLVSVAARG